MKKVVLSCFCAGMLSVQANEVPESGMYVGMGLVNSQDKTDWEINTVAFGTVGYQTSFFSDSIRHFNGQFFAGYKNYDPFSSL